jgi:DNA-binding LacI/PurR family transcriptional regulator
MEDTGGRRRVGIKEVAEAAQVSATTVSHALNGKGRVTSETRERIKDIADRLGYRPHQGAQHLRRGTSGIIALVVSTADKQLMRFAEYDYFRSLIDGAASEALARGKWLVLIPSATEPCALRSLELDGAIVVDPTIDDEVLAVLQESGVPTVVSGRAMGEQSVASVDNDLGAGTAMVLDHLRQEGATRIALVNAPPAQSYALDAEVAYTAWVQEHDAPCLIAHATSLDEDAGYVAATRLFESDARPDAVFAILDRVAAGVMLAARNAGLRIPQDLLLASTTDSPRSRTMRPALTVLDLSQEEVGRLAVEELLSLIDGGTPPGGRRIVPVKLKVRATSTRRAAVAVRDEDS